MSYPTGKLELVRERLYDYVGSALGGSVYADYRIEVNIVGTYPISHVGIETFNLVTENFGRRTPEVGYWSYYDFYVFIHNKLENEFTYTRKVPTDHSVMDDADTLVDYFLSIRGNESEKTNYGIYWIDQIRIERVGQRGRPDNIATCVVAGRIRAKWLDITTTSTTSTSTSTSTSTTSTSTSTSTSTTAPPVGVYTQIIYIRIGFDYVI